MLCKQEGQAAGRAAPERRASMAQVIYRKGFSGGSIPLPPSKSAAHRAVLCAALSRGKCVVSNVDWSDDIAATAEAVRTLGAEAEFDPGAGTLAVDASGLRGGSGGIDCGESGSTLRFLIPVAAALGGSWRFTGRGRLPLRPLGIYEELLPEHGVAFRTEGGLPLSIEGTLEPGEYRLPGNVSSQFVTGLLLALPLLSGDSEIVLTSPLESKGYVDLTVSMLEEFGVTVSETERGWEVPGGQCFRPREYTVEGDWSQAAFFLSMAALSPEGSVVRLCGLNRDSRQGDKACVDLFERFGLKTRWRNGALEVWNPNAGSVFGGLRGFTIDASQIPDMVPALAVCAALSQGETRIVRAERLRLKESDRLAAMEEALGALGGRVRSTPDGLIFHGVEALRGGTVRGRNDHRVVMALAAAALRCEGEVTVTDAWSIRKSYPGFFADFGKLGGNAHVVDLG